jgi:hypothetical protein
MGQTTSSSRLAIVVIVFNESLLDGLQATSNECSVYLPAMTTGSWPVSPFRTTRYAKINGCVAFASFRDLSFKRCSSIGGTCAGSKRATACPMKTDRDLQLSSKGNVNRGALFGKECDLHCDRRAAVYDPVHSSMLLAVTIFHEYGCTRCHRYLHLGRQSSSRCFRVVRSGLSRFAFVIASPCGR